VSARGEEGLIATGELEVETIELGVAGFELAKAGAGVVAEGDHGCESGAVLALEAVEEVKAFLEGVEALGIELEAFEIAAEVGLQFAEGGDGLGVEGDKAVGGGIQAREFLEEATEGTGLGEDGGVILAEDAEGGLAELEEAGSVLGALVLVFDFSLLVGTELGGGDFLDLKAEEIELLSVGLFVDDERGLLGGEGDAFAQLVTEGGHLGLEAAKGVEDGELPGGLEEGLVVMGPMNVDQGIAELGEDREGGGRAVDELAVDTGRGKGALEEELLVFARLEAVVFEAGVDGGGEAAHVEGGLDGAGGFPGADEGAFGPFAEEQAEGTQDD
jgi:hypothetical protein